MNLLPTPETLWEKEVQDYIYLDEELYQNCTNQTIYNMQMVYVRKFYLQPFTEEMKHYFLVLRDGEYINAPNFIPAFSQDVETLSDFIFYALKDGIKLKWNQY